MPDDGEDPPRPTRGAAASPGGPLVADERAAVVDDGLLYLDRYWGEEGQVVADVRPGCRRRLRRAGRLSTPRWTPYFPDDAYDDQRAAAATPRAGTGPP